ncbi:MAG: phospholipid carrier-dependent glycosyltransferase [Streptomycetales bacterium]
MIRRHGLFLTLLCLGVLLRGVVQVAYQPAILYIDSYLYLFNNEALDPSMLRPIGYNALLLRWVLPFHDLAYVALLQHLLGLGMAVLIYLLLLRRDVPRWLAALAATPVLLDGYQLQIEHNVMSDVLFQALVLGGLAMLAWRREPAPAAAAAAGLLLGLAVTVRIVGAPLVLSGVCYLLLAGPGLRRRLASSALLAACFAVPVGGYASWYEHTNDSFQISGYRGKTYYGRVAPFADCSQLRGAYFEALCPNEPVGVREGVDYYAHDPSSPGNRLAVPAGVDREALIRDFAYEVIGNQPLDFATAVGRDFLKNFTPGRTTAPEDVPLERWRFQESYPVWPPYQARETVREYGGEGPSVAAPLAALLRDYQRFGYLPGTALAGLLVAGAVAAAGLGRAGGSGMRAATFLFTVTGGGLLLASAMAEFSWRYQLPALVLLPVGGALGLAALLGRPGSDARGAVVQHRPQCTARTERMADVP